MKQRAVPIAVTTAILVALVAVFIARGDGDFVPDAPAAQGLRAFESCDELAEYARRNADRMQDAWMDADGDVATPMAAPTDTGGEAAQEPSAAPADGASGTSRTNVQEQGVDEPDVVKADGALVYTVVGDELRTVDTSGGEPRVLDTLALEGSGHELLVEGDRALVISQGDGPIRTTLPEPPGDVAIPEPRTDIVPEPQLAGATVIAEIDVSDPAELELVRSQEVEGRYESARLTDGTARIVVVTSPRTPDDTDAREDAEAWMPRTVVREGGDTTERPLTGCGDVRRPSDFSGLGMLSVLTIDVARGLPAVDTDSLMTSADTVYGAPESLYVATERWAADDEDAEDSGPATAIHRFDASQRGTTVYRSSGEVDGELLSQWALSEHDGVLRVASTDGPAWGGGDVIVDGEDESESHVTTLRERGNKLEQVGRVSGLGRGERIYAVRFIDDVGYVVTFRQTDPLYTIDLSDPSDPRVTGELKIEGYSAYLHPVGEDLLLGVGQDATLEGRRLGTQLSLFDVSDPANPRRIHQRTLGEGSSSEVEFDHHAFLWWEPSQLAVIPVQRSSMDGTYPGAAGATGFRVDRDAGIDEVGRAEHREGVYGAAVTRSLVVDGRLVTLSQTGLGVHDLGTLADTGWIAFA